MGWALLGLSLAACEAPLDLAAVEDQRDRPVQRADLFQAAARHLDTVMVVGAMGVVVHSADGGKNWQRSVLPGNPFLIDVSSCPDGSFHAIEKTDGLWTLQPDGAWSRQPLPDMTEPQAMTCDAANTLWVTGGYSSILHSDDAGANWDTWSLEEDLFLTTIQFVDDLHGFVTGEFGTVLVSGDGGLNWEAASELPDSFYPQSAIFTNPATGWVVGLDGIIWQTDSGGETWQPSPSGINTPLYGIAGTGGNLLAVGDNTTVLSRGSAAAAWQPLDTVGKTRTYLRAVAELGDGSFVVAGGGTLFTVTRPKGREAASEGGAANE